MSARRRWPIARPSRKTARSITPTRSSPAARASSRRVKLRFEPDERGAGFIFENDDRRRYGAEGIRSRRRKGLEEAMETGVLAGFPMVDFKVDAVRRCLPRRRLRACWRSKSPPAPPSAKDRQGRSEAAGADHAGRSGDAGRLHGRRHRRSEQPSRPDQRHGQPRQCAGDRCHGAAGQHVRLCEHAFAR